MKKIGFLTMILMFGVFSVMAQNTGDRGSRQRLSPEERAKQQVERLDETLDLNKEQEEKVYDIYVESGKKMSAMREEMSDGGDRESMREKMMEIRSEENKKMKEVLTEEQWVKYEKYQQEMRSRRGQGRQRR